MTSKPAFYFPVELIEPIIKHAGRYSTQDLKSLSLVSKIWTPIAQSLLFASVEIHTNFIHTSPAIFCGSDDTTYACNSVALMIPSSPPSARLASSNIFSKTLQVHATSQVWLSVLDIFHRRKDKLASEVQAVIPSYLAMCTKLESLRFEFCYWDIFQGIYEPLFAAL
ncbi:hypothetical protein CPB85DRAFT_1314753, partial [Mucidula mucida]